MGVVFVSVCDPYQRMDEGHGVVVVGEAEASANRLAFFDHRPLRRLRAESGDLAGRQPMLFTTTRLAMALSQVIIGWVHARSPDVMCGTSIKRSEEHTSELQSLMRISYAVFCLKKKK